MQRSNGLPINEELQHRIEEFARLHGMTPAEVVRVAFDQYEFGNNDKSTETDQPSNGETLYDRLKRAGVIGAIKGGPDSPTDLSTNPKYMEGFGRD